MWTSMDSTKTIHCWNFLWFFFFRKIQNVPQHHRIETEQSEAKERKRRKVRTFSAPRSETNDSINVCYCCRRENMLKNSVFIIFYHKHTLKTEGEQELTGIYLKSENVGIFNATDPKSDECSEVWLAMRVHRKFQLVVEPKSAHTNKIYGKFHSLCFLRWGCTFSLNKKCWACFWGYTKKWDGKNFEKCCCEMIVTVDVESMQREGESLSTIVCVDCIMKCEISFLTPFWCSTFIAKSRAIKWWWSKVSFYDSLPPHHPIWASIYVHKNNF